VLFERIRLFLPAERRRVKLISKICSCQKIGSSCSHNLFLFVLSHFYYFLTPLASPTDLTVTSTYITPHASRKSFVDLRIEAIQHSERKTLEYSIENNRHMITRRLPIYFLFCRYSQTLLVPLRSWIVQLAIDSRSRE